MREVNPEAQTPHHELQSTRHEILVWLPSPLGDAILCTPALRALRRYFKSCKIFFFANPTVRQVLSPCNFNDEWLEQKNKNPLAIAKQFKEHKFTHAILFKNSFASALACLLAAIQTRTGYAREKRGFLLTDKLYPPKLPDGTFKPLSMIDYYLAIASWLGAETTDRNLELLVDPLKRESLKSKLPELFNCNNSIVILIPGGTFGPSKCWPPDRFAQTAEHLIDNYNAKVVLSVAPEPAERQIAEEICNSSKHKLINLGEKPLNLGELKALFSVADLVISNDTGPRHIAIALGRKVISLFGPNDPAWTDTGYENEIQIVGDVPCAPCRKPVCTKSEHFCMQAITVEMVCDAAKKLLEHKRKQSAPADKQEFIETSNSLFVDADYQTAFSKLGLTSIDAVFSFNAAENLTKDNLARFRSRMQFEIDSPELLSSTTVFLKRYDHPPILVQLKNWFSSHSRKSCGFREFTSAEELSAAGINTPKTIAYGEQCGTLFERRSFIIAEKIPDAESIERKLPDCFDIPATRENLRRRRDFVSKLARFIKGFHATNYRHRDLYFSHIFYDYKGQFHLIDLARAFKPRILRRRFQIKDIAQLYYSAPAKYFSKTDRLRFYIGYTGRKKLTRRDRVFIRKVINKAKRMARHDIKHNRQVPFAG
jgi:heptosyltransferase-2